MNTPVNGIGFPKNTKIVPLTDKEKIEVLRILSGYIEARLGQFASPNDGTGHCVMDGEYYFELRLDLESKRYPWENQIFQAGAPADVIKPEEMDLIVRWVIENKLWMNMKPE
jgi:hypothetical protein